MHNLHNLLQSLSPSARMQRALSRTSLAAARPRAARPAAVAAAAHAITFQTPSGR